MMMTERFVEPFKVRNDTRAGLKNSSNRRNGGMTLFFPRPVREEESERAATSRGDDWRWSTLL